MDITLKLGTLDVHEKVSTYNVRREVSYSKVITTMDDTEHAARSILQCVEERHCKRDVYRSL